MPRPVIYVLAGVNGAGKSSIGGHLLERAGLTWFNPDSYARELIAHLDGDHTQANATAWAEGLRRLDAALAQGRTYAFETTLGGRTIPARLRQAAATHDVLMWFCGLDTPERHIQRVRARVAQGGHDIPEAKIRERYPAALVNLIGLMPHLAQLQVYDNSAEAALGEPIPGPRLLMQMENGKLVWPLDVEALRRTPEWVKAVVEAGLGVAR